VFGLFFCEANQSVPRTTFGCQGSETTQEVSSPLKSQNMRQIIKRQFTIPEVRSTCVCVIELLVRGKKLSGLPKVSSIVVIKFIFRR
jgi:hypothetical protein